jgi:hypothetical protein
LLQDFIILKYVHSHHGARSKLIQFNHVCGRRPVRYSASRTRYRNSDDGARPCAIITSYSCTYCVARSHAYQAADPCANGSTNSRAYISTLTKANLHSYISSFIQPDSSALFTSNFIANTNAEFRTNTKPFTETIIRTHPCANTTSNFVAHCASESSAHTGPYL